MEKVIPRWEWRTLGKNLHQGEANIKKYELTLEREFRSLY